jgi:signal peptidase I
MQAWIGLHADVIFYGLMIGLAVAEVVLRWVLRVAKTSVVLEYVDSGFIAILLALVIRTFLVQTFWVPSGSMETTLLPGDLLIVNKFIYGTHIPFTDRTVWRFRDPRRGDVVVFRSKFPPPKDTFVKRCMGLPGDVLEMKDKVLYINGQPLAEPYVRHRDVNVLPRGVDELGRADVGSPDPAGSRDNFGPITVPPDHYFMMGDNRDESFDSRYWGFVRRDRFQGNAMVVYWPVARWKVIQ